MGIRNLAGVPADTATECVASELNAAGIQWVHEKLDHRDEVQSRVVGLMLDPRGRLFRFVRRWCYWSARVYEGSALSIEEATALDVSAYDGPRSYYGGNRGVLGDVARWRGYAGGRPPATLWSDDVRDQHWHIDTAEGLAAFARWVRTAS